MPITKTGNALLKGLGAVGDFAGKAFPLAMTGLMAGQTAYDIVSGEDSVGGSIGGLAGGLAGFDLGQKLIGKLPKVKYLSTPLSMIGGMAAGVVGDSLGRSVGNAIASWQRGLGAQAQSLAGGSQNFPPQPYEGQNVQIG